MRFAQADAFHLPLADDSVSMVFTSPPYADARTYGIGAQRECVEWVEWMVPIVVECVRVSLGPVFIVCAGVTRDRNYWPCCEGLIYEAWKRGIQCYRPHFWHRVGIPGSGGDDFHRADVEYVWCFKRPGALPWSDNTANGHPPKWGPGGEMSNRLTNGSRVNQWGKNGSPRGMGNKNADGKIDSGVRPSHIQTTIVGESDEPATRPSHSPGPNRRANGKYKVTRERGGDDRVDEMYKPLVLANPGNLVSDFGSLKAIDILTSYAILNDFNPDHILQDMRRAVDSENLRQWFAGIHVRVLESKILQPQMSRRKDGAAERSKVGRTSAQRQKNRPAHDGKNPVLGMWENEAAGSSSQERRCDGQPARESPGSLSLVSQEETQTRRMFRSRLHSSILRKGLLLSSLAEMEQVRESIDEATRSSSSSAVGSNLMSIPVGGGMLGSEHAHTNEAPFGMALAEWFIRAFCPPNGICFDPFSGSGTTVAAAVNLGRRGIGFDLRMSQCVLGKRRMVNSQPPLFAQASRACPAAVVTTIPEALRLVRSLTEKK